MSKVSKTIKNTNAKTVSKKVPKKEAPKPIVPIKTEIVTEPFKFTNRFGCGLVRLAEVVVNKKEGKGNVVWKGKFPMKVYVIPDPKIPNCYRLKNMTLEQEGGGEEFTVTHMESGIYRVTDSDKYPDGMWRARFYKIPGSKNPVADMFCRDENARDWVERCSGKDVQKMPKKIERVVTAKPLTNDTHSQNNTHSQNSVCKMTEILVKFAEKIDADFNLLSVCQVNARKYAEDYVERELKGNKFNLEKACSEFKEFLADEVESKVVEKEEKKNVSDVQKGVKPVIDKKVAEKVLQVTNKEIANPLPATQKPSKKSKKGATVISLKGKATEWGSQLEKCPDDVVYIGRKNNRGGWDLKASRFQNPYTVTKAMPRGEAISKYKEYITTKITEDSTLKEELLSYKGKRLACWCSPEACHGDVLCEIITSIENGTFDKKEQKEAKGEVSKGKGEGRKVVAKTDQKVVSKKTKKNTPHVTEEEMKRWFESKDYKVADIREILQKLKIPGITNTSTKKAMKDIASKYLVEDDSV